MGNCGWATYTFIKMGILWRDSSFQPSSDFSYSLGIILGIMFWICGLPVECNMLIASAIHCSHHHPVGKPSNRVIALFSWTAEVAMAPPLFISSPIIYDKDTHLFIFTVLLNISDSRTWSFLLMARVSLFMCLHNGIVMRDATFRTALASLSCPKGGSNLRPHSWKPIKCQNKSMNQKQTIAHVSLFRLCP
jgi:hypothetical protein